MDQVPTFFKGDEQFIKERLASFKELSDEKLWDYYHDVTKNGFFGVRAQTLTVMALRHEFDRRFGMSPIEYKNGVLKDRAIRTEEEA
jgi:hypothetical protein